MWTYVQRSGAIIADSGEVISYGYAGHGPGKNNPDDHAKNEGPLPVGFYVIGPPHDTDTHGPVVMVLTPDPTNAMYGRDGFLMHGDSVAHPGAASLGCIVASRPARERVAASGDTLLHVIADPV